MSTHYDETLIDVNQRLIDALKDTNYVLEIALAHVKRTGTSRHAILARYVGNRDLLAEVERLAVCP